MKLTRLQRLFILLTALWLPLQAVAGMTMQFCRHDVAPQDVQQPATAAAEEHCLYHDGAPAEQDKQAQGQGQGCDSCGICHLTCSGYMPPSALTTAFVPAQRMLHIWPAAALPSHIPEPPQYPPKRSV